MSNTLALVSRGFLSSAALTIFVSACATGQPDDASTSGEPAVAPVRITEKAAAPVAGDAASSALRYVRGHEIDLELSGRDDFEVVSVHQGSDKLTHVRLQQTYQGVKVWGADLVVHASSSDYLGLNGTVAVHLSDLDLEATLSADRALEIGKGEYTVQDKAGASTLAYDREHTELVILPRAGRDAVLAWHVVFFTELQAGINPGLWNYMIDADTGEVLERWNGIHTLAQASGTGGNPKVARSWVDALDVEPSGDHYIMQTSRLLTLNMNSNTSGGTAVAGPLNDIGDAAINDAHGFAEVTLNMLRDWMGQNSIDDRGFSIRSRVHYGRQYENAFWDGVQMTYGDGRSTFHPLSGDIDVVSHEINHGYTEFHSSLIYSGMSGGMNESFSDVAGTVAEYYSEGEGADWDLGRDIFRGDQALRYMCDPRQDGRSINHASQYRNGMDVHFSSGVGNRAFCLSARRLATGSPDGTPTVESVKRAGQVWYAANASYWTRSSTFTQACQGVMDAAAALGLSEAEREAIAQSWSDVGVFCGGAPEPIQCDETFTAETGTLTSPNYSNAYPNNFRRTWCIQPASGRPATLRFDALNTEAGYDFVDIKDANGAQLSSNSGTSTPADSTSTILVVKFTSDGSGTRAGWSASWTTGGTENQGPTVSITEPASPATVTGDVVVAASAADPDGSVARVRFELPDGTSVDDHSAPYEVAWDSSSVADGGNYQIRATAYDNLGAPSDPATAAVSISNGAACVGASFSAADLPISIPDNSSTGISSSLEVSGPGSIGAMTLSLDISHTWRGDLVVTLLSPSGTSYSISAREGGSAENITLTDHAVTAFDGQAASGTWRLTVQDLAYADIGVLDSWSLAIQGDCSVQP